MINIIVRLILALFIFSFSVLCRSETTLDKRFQHPLYFGLLGGYGSTTWQGLVPSSSNVNLAIAVSAPIEVEEGGGVWGGFAGYEFNSNFQLEAMYMRYPTAHVIFDSGSIFSFMNDDQIDLFTHTESVSLMGKMMVFLPRTYVRAFSSFGIASVHRQDILSDRWKYTPTFGLGLNYHFTEHLMTELAVNYTAGFGESNLNPTASYFPFLYSASLHIAYCY